jgi:hypothetical protein
MDHDASYVLLDMASDDRAAFESKFLERNGHPVHLCGGPGDSACPILAGAGCELFDSAHGVIFQLDLDRPAHQAILAKYREAAGDELPIRVVVEARQAEEYADLLTDFEVWTHEPSVADLDGFAAEVDATDR